MLPLANAADFDAEILQTRPVSTGNSIIDEMIGGGLKRGYRVYLFGNSSATSQILMDIAVNAFLPPRDGGYSEPAVIYVDGKNRFSPHYLSTKAVSSHLGPRHILNHIIVSRVFTWSQMVEVMEERIINIAEKHIYIILISGLLDLFAETAFQNGVVNKECFHDLHRIFSGIKQISAQYFPIVVFTGPANAMNFSQPIGGKIATHFANVILGMNENERQLYYHLVQHPFRREIRRTIWKSPMGDISLSYSRNNWSENRRIESFIRRNSK